MGLSCQRVEQETDGKEANAKESRGDRELGASKHRLVERFSHLKPCGVQVDLKIHMICTGEDKGNSPT